MITVELNIKEVEQAILSAVEEVLHAYHWLRDDYERGIIDIDGAELLSSFEHATVRFREKVDEA